MKWHFGLGFGLTFLALNVQAHGIGLPHLHMADESVLMLWGLVVIVFLAVGGWIWAQKSDESDDV